ncbi:MAG: hypothetical protein JWR03_3250 [Cohnella sp.]|nr:hypothetical protein [Cohnella sp.]
MSGIGGKVWYGTRGSVPDWLRVAGVLALPEGVEPGMDDCVLCLDGEGRVAGEAVRTIRSPWRMNGTAGVTAAIAYIRIVQRLEREGSRVVGRDGGQAVETRRFTVTVFDLEATDVRRVRRYDGKKRIVERTEPDDRLRRIVVRAAVRAIYSLGLDFGQVEVETDNAGRPSIAGLSPVMRPSPGEGERRTAQVIRAFAAGWEAETAGGVVATLGADPEFVLLSREGKIVPASRYFPRDGAAGCDSVVVRGVKVWPLAELRPEPAAEPGAVAAQLRRLLRAASLRCGEAPLAWRAGAWPVRGLPLGGHVHVSGAALTGERLRALDNAVALPLRLLEPPGAAARRPRYGALGDFRRQSHGGFEYRTPPSWLVSPRLTRGVLALAKIAAEHSRELAAVRPLDEDTLREVFYGDTVQDRLRDSALQFYESVQRTAGYPRYADDVDFVFRSVREGRHWDETADIRRKWGIPVK